MKLFPKDFLGNRS